MNPVKVKICGITRVEDLRIAVNAGADAVGVVVGVPSSPRNLSPKKAKALIAKIPLFVNSVVVTVSDNLNQLTTLYRELTPNAIQIHGDGLPGTILRGAVENVRLIRAVQVRSTEAVRSALEAAKAFDAVLLDSYLPGKEGGTGKTHDWELDRLIQKTIHPKPLILAGGLTSENVKTAIRIVQPFAVDVSSGVESRPGLKDPKKVFEFIKNAKEVE